MPIPSVGPLNFRNWSLKARIALFTLAIFVTSFWALALYVSQFLQRDMQQLLTDQQFASVSLVASQINSDVEERMSSLQMIATSFTTASLADASALQADLEQRALTKRLFNRGIFVTDAAGIAIASSPVSAGRTGSNFMDKEHVVTALKEGKATIGRPTIGALGAPVIVMAVPIRDAQEIVIGALIGVTDLGEPNFLDKVADNRFGQTGGFVLVAPKYRQIITSGDKRRMMELLPPPGKIPLNDRFIDGHEGAGILINPLGVEVLTAAKSVPSAGWYVGVSLPTEEAFAPVHALNRRLLTTAILLTLIVGLITWWMVQRQLRPMLTAIETMKSLSGVELPPRALPVKRLDEVGQLITSFNQLLGTIAEREAASKEAQNLLGRIASRVPGMVYQFRLNPDGTSCFPYSSAGIREIYRVEPDEVREDASKVFAVLYPDDFDVVAASIGQSAERLTLWVHEYRVKFADGTVRWLQGNAMPQREDDGAVLWHGFITDITERKRAEVALRESERRFGELLENMPSVAVQGFSIDGRVHYWNVASEQLYGYTAAEAMGRDIGDLVLPTAERPNYRRTLKQMADTGQAPPPMEMSLARKDGSPLQVYASHAIVDTRGQPVEVYCFDIDLTERRQMEREVQIQRDFAAQILNAMGQGVSVTSAKGLIEFANPALAALLGYSPSELIGKGHDEIFVEEDAARQPKILAQREAGVSSTYEARFRRSDGTPVPVQVIGVPRLVDGRYTGSIAVITDLSDRVRAEQALTESAQRFRMLTELSPEAIVVHADGVVRYANQAAVSLYGGTAEDQLVGRSVEDFVHPESRQAVSERAKQVAAGVEVLPLAQIKNIKLDGTVIDIESYAVATVFDGVPAVRLSIRDITARSRAEAERVSLEAQLRESQKMQAVGTLAGGVAHDFNNILAAILGNSELAREDSAGNKRALESIDEIRKAATRARDLVQQILSFSRRQPTERKLLKLDAVVEESRRLLRATLPMRLSMAVQCDKGTPNVLADATQIQQVIINLATNAMQAMPTGQGRIDIHLGTIALDQYLLTKQPKLQAMATRHSGHAVRLSVQDSGPGIPPEMVGRIFEPFFTTKPVNEGTGLGLSVVHGIVDGHEGVIAVTSMVGVGTTFDIYLPVATEGAVFKPSTLPTITSGSLAVKKATGLRLLYLDDDDAIVFLTSRLLGRKGFCISPFSNQQEALDTVRATPNAFDVVVTDYNMPGISGVDVANEIRAIRSDLPVIIASGFVDEDLQAKAVAAGVKALIFKETIVDKFVNAIASAVEAV
jgi:PAS domain S-box-containing protein